MRQIFIILVLFYLHNCTGSWPETSISLNDPMPCKLDDLGMDCNAACKKISANLHGCCRTEMKLREPCYGPQRAACCCNEDNSESPQPERYCEAPARYCEGCCCAPPKNLYRYYCGCEGGDQPGPEEFGEGRAGGGGGGPCCDGGYGPEPEEGGEGRAGGGSPCCGGRVAKNAKSYCCGAARDGHFGHKFKSCYCCEQTDEETSSNTNLGTCTILPHQVLSANLGFSEDTFCNSKQNCQPLFINNIELSFGKQITACKS